MAEIDELQQRANRLLGADRPGLAATLTAVEEARAPFSPFVPEQLERALAVTERLMAVADEPAG